jgi:hypothetical protein
MIWQPYPKENWNKFLSFYKYQSYAKEHFLQRRAQSGRPPGTNVLRSDHSYIKIFFIFFRSTSHINEEVNCTEPFSPSVSVPCLGLSSTPSLHLEVKCSNDYATDVGQEKNCLCCLNVLSGQQIGRHNGDGDKTHCKIACVNASLKSIFSNYISS